MDEGFCLSWIFEYAERYLANWAIGLRMVAVPVFPNVNSRFASHFSQTSLLIPITREFQDALLITSRETAGCNHSQVTAPKRQAQTSGIANICPSAFRELCLLGPISGESLGGFANELPLLLPLRSAQSRASHFPLNRHLIDLCP
jgi:hypothetical protein